MKKIKEGLNFVKDFAKAIITTPEDFPATILLAVILIIIILAVLWVP